MNQSLQSFLKNNFGIYSVLSVLSLIIYHNALKCGFVFDDVSAIIENEDLRPSISWSKLLEHDFWGTPMSEERSHKSYRPLTVATFKLNYFFNDLNPFPYHAVNIVIHAIVCCLNYRLCVLVTDVCSQHDTVETNTEPKIIPQKLKVSKRKKLQKKIYQEDLLKPLNKDDQTNLAISFVAALLFTVHPVHTEAVTGVVGRAELLSALFYLLAMITYTSISFKNNFLSSIFCLLAVACKEQGITILALCVIYDVFIAHKLSVFEFITMKKQSSLTVLLRCLLFVLTVMLILLWRLTVMTTMPAFSKYDNPAAFESFPTKQLTFNYLLVVNALLLLCPINLLCDWSMGTVPLVEDVMDSRNMLTLLFWIAMLALAYKSFAGKSSTDKLILFGSTLLVVSFLPASNFFFSVGFVVAERVLYVPSMGFCLLVATAMVKLWKISHLKPLVACFLFVTVVCHSLKTITRNEDWLNDYTLFNSGLKVTSYNAKVWNNVGHYFEKRNDFQQALDYFQQAVKVQPDDIGSHINVGKTFEQLQQYSHAEKVFTKAKLLLPKLKNKPSRIPEKHLEIFSHLAELIKRDNTRLTEADELYKEAIRMRRSYMKAYINRGELLLLMNEPIKAIECYGEALKQNTSASHKADLYFNIGVVQSQLYNVSAAMEAYTYAILHNNDHKMALYNSAIILEGTGDVELLRRAKVRIDHVLKLDPNDKLSLLLLGSIYIKMNKQDKAVDAWKQLLKIESNNEGALFNLAYMHSQAGKIDPCLSYLEQLLTHHPIHDRALLLYGDIMLNHKNNTQAAKKAFTKLVEVDADNSQGQHNLCVVMVHEGHLEDAELCLLQVLHKNPESKFANQNLAVIRKKLAFKAASEQEKKYMNELSFSDNVDEEEPLKQDGDYDRERKQQNYQEEEDIVYIEPMKKKMDDKNDEEGRILLKKAKNLLENAKASIETSKKTEGSLEKKMDVQNKAFVSVKEAIKQLQSINKQMDETKNKKDGMKEGTKTKEEKVDPEKRKKDILNWLDDLEKQLF